MLKLLRGLVPTQQAKGCLMFEVSTNWINGLGQVLVYALIISAGLWVMSKIEMKGKDNE
jgi:hypothetical protein